MSTATLAPPVRPAAPALPAKAAPVPAVDPRDVEALRYRFTRDDYERISELGILDGRRTRLIDGYVLAMSAVGVPHTMGTNFTVDALEAVFDPRRYFVRKADPMMLGSEYCVPDVAVVAGTIRSWTGQPHPTSALLLVEVADTSLSLDRWTQAGLCASVAVADYWILNLIDRVLEVHRGPVADAAWPFGHRYASVQVLDVNASVSPLAMPSASISVADLLP